jgi:hypothetical protein
MEGKPRSTMRGKALVALLLAAMLFTPVQGGDVTAQQATQEDPKQPSANSSTLYLYHDGFADAWTHFADNDTDSTEEGELREEKDDGVIDINLRFRMKPDLDRQLLMTENGEVRGNIKIDVGGDWTNGDNNGPCNNDCENLNITVFKGATELWTNQFTGIQQGEQTVPFTFTLTEEHLQWDGRDDSPIIQLTMKVKGDLRNGVFPGTTNGGTPAHFAIKLGMDSRVELPVDEASWNEDFVLDTGDTMDEEDTPGFTLVTASAALGMALFTNRKNESEA